MEHRIGFKVTARDNDVKEPPTMVQGCVCFVLPLGEGTIEEEMY